MQTFNVHIKNNITFCDAVLYGIIWFLLNNQSFFYCCFFSDRVFGPKTTTEAVYDVAARPVVKGAMEGINGMSPILI
jgi:hypothetical protein